MGTLSFSITSTPLTATKNYTVSDADVQSWINYLVSAYPAANNVPAQAFLALLNDWLGNQKNLVKQFNTTPPPPIVFS